MEVPPICRTTLWTSVGKTVQKLQEGNVRRAGNRSTTEDVLSTTMCLVEQSWRAGPLTPVSSEVQDLEAITQNHFLLGNKNVCLPFLPCAEEFVDHRNRF